MGTNWNIFDDIEGFIITGVLTIIGMMLYGVLLAVFYLREYHGFALVVAYILFGGECLTMLFQGIYFCVRDGSTMLANSVFYIIVSLAQVGILVAWGLWIFRNKDEQDVEGCPICGDKMTP